MKINKVLKVLTFDLHPITRRGIRLMLENMALPMNVSEASGEQQFYKSLQTSDFDLVVLSVNETISFDARKLAAALPRTVLLYTEEGAEDAITLMAMGAGACMSKKCMDTELRNGISAVLDKRRYRCLFTRALTDTVHQPAFHFDIHSSHAQRSFI